MSAKKNDVQVPLEVPDEQERLDPREPRNNEQRLRADIGKYPLIPREKEWELATRWHTTGDTLAMQALVLHNARFCIKASKSFSWTGVPIDDLIGLGFIGMLEGAQRFKADRRVKFTTYAMWWIRKEILHELSKYHGGMILKPKYIEKLLKEFKRIIAALKAELGHEPSPKEIADASGFSISKIELFVQMMRSQKQVHLDSNIDEDENETNAALIADPNAVQPYDHLEQNKYKEWIQSVLPTLPGKHEVVLRLRYGIGTDSVLTLKQIGEKLHISRERARLIERQGLHLLRQELSRRDLIALSKRDRRQKKGEREVQPPPAKSPSDFQKFLDTLPKKSPPVEKRREDSKISRF